MLCRNGDQDADSPVGGIHAIEPKVRPAYALYAAGPNFQSVVYPGVGHQYLPDMWQKTLAWCDQHLKAK